MVPDCMSHCACATATTQPWRERGKKEGGEKNYSRQGFIHELQGLRDISLKPELGPPGAARQLPKLHFPLLLDIHALCIPANGLDSCA